MSQRNLTYLNNKRMIYRRLPTTDKPDIDTKEFMYFQNGTHQATSYLDRLQRLLRIDHSSGICLFCGT